jgi:hypothetical protein
VTITNQSNQKAGYEFEETKYVLDLCPELDEAKAHGREWIISVLHFLHMQEFYWKLTWDDP